tara:strand:+ start:126 stop:1217 length:1092 start_codon:yes stop_codon:yes gene_type:complete
MSVGSNLQEMENVVTKKAASADPMPSSGIPVEDLGGPTPENNSPTDDSNKLKDPAATLAQVRDVVNAKAARAEEVEVEEDQEVVAEAEETEEEVVSEEETTEEEVVAESEETTEEVIQEEEIDIEGDVQALLEGEELSEEFQEKARTIFEAAIKTKVSEIKENLETAYQQALVEELETIKEGLTERVDSYLEYVADEWIQENALQVEHGLKTEMTESFLEGMKSLFEEHYVTIPEDRYDVIESMVDKLDEMENKLNEQIDRNVALNRRLAESTSDVIFSEVAEGLALSQKDKFASLAENVEFESEADYREKLVTLKKSYFPEQKSTQSETTETISEGVITESTQQVSGRMESYLSTLGRVSKK